MPKITRKSNLSITNAPLTRKQEKPRSLGLKSKEGTRNQTFRMREETIDVLGDLVTEINKHINLKINKTNFLDLLINRAANSDIKEIIDYINKQ